MLDFFWRESIRVRLPLTAYMFLKTSFHSQTDEIRICQYCLQERLHDIIKFIELLSNENSTVIMKTVLLLENLHDT